MYKKKKEKKKWCEVTGVGNQWEKLGMKYLLEMKKKE